MSAGAVNSAEIFAGERYVVGPNPTYGWLGDAKPSYSRGGTVVTTIRQYPDGDWEVECKNGIRDAIGPQHLLPLPEIEVPVDEVDEQAAAAAEDMDAAAPEPAPEPAVEPLLSREQAARREALAFAASLLRGGNPERALAPRDLCTLAEFVLREKS